MGLNQKLISHKNSQEKIIALAGNPNVGKSTVFNSLTGLNQHTGNWPGKTVVSAQGRYKYKDQDFVLVDLPGTYSLMATSIEEAIARDFICFGQHDAVVVVADATCLERNLNLILQILEITQNVVVCVNLLDEAKKKKIKIDLDELSLQLGVHVVGTSARKGSGLDELLDKIYRLTILNKKTFKVTVNYGNLENAINILEPVLKETIKDKIDARWLSLKLLERDKSIIESLSDYLGFDIYSNLKVKTALESANKYLEDENIKQEFLHDKIVTRITEHAEKIYNQCIFLENKFYNHRDRKIDHILTSKSTGIPIMIFLLGIIFWITLEGANYPSEVLSSWFFNLQDKLISLFQFMHAPEWLTNSLILGVYRTLAWVVSVMLPPMAIFFPLFTLLEDSGYLPRIAFNMDKFFRNSGAHGKQALTMCMGFGCNACGVIGCRIIDSPRERLIAILTNNFVPCNGRFPTLIAIITMFFTGIIISPFESIVSTCILIGVILIGIFMTLLTSKLLSHTILKGLPSSFMLELPPYRKPQFIKVIVRSIFDRTLFVLGRAVVIAAPAGLIIWLMSNINIHDMSILAHCTQFLDPFAKFIGLDGVILMAFILGFPANEIVIPIIIMSYMCTGSILELSSLDDLRVLLINNGWTWLTATCTMLFSLMHFPCGTTCWTIQKETKSIKWTAAAFILPTAIGLLTCFIITSLARMFNLV